MAVSREIMSGSVAKRGIRCVAASIRCTRVQGEGGLVLPACCRAGAGAGRGWAACRCTGTCNTLCVRWAAWRRRFGEAMATWTAGIAGI
jgi:hypothetical protein